MMHASGEFDVTLAPRESQAGDDSSIGRLVLDKHYHGDLDGPSRGDMLSSQTESTGAAVYVAIERFTGVLRGKRGSFVLAHLGTMTSKDQKLDVIIVPGSGTDELIGISGTMSIRIENKKHFYDVSYTLADAH